MTRKVDLPGAGTAKVINPWGAFVLALVTFGVYYVVWYGWRNDELNSYGKSLSEEDNPLRVWALGSMLAITVGWLVIVPPFVSQWRFYNRIRRAQELAGVEDRISPGSGFLLFVLAPIVLPFDLAYAQHHLNRLWGLFDTPAEHHGIEQGAAAS